MDKLSDIAQKIYDIMKIPKIYTDNEKNKIPRISNIL